MCAGPSSTPGWTLPNCEITPPCWSAPRPPFAPDTEIATLKGDWRIAALKVGDQVVAYAPKTDTATTRTVERVLVHRDTDLVDVTLRVTAATHAPGGKVRQTPGAVTATPTHDEVVHTTAHHRAPPVADGGPRQAAGELPAPRRAGAAGRRDDGDGGGHSRGDRRRAHVGPHARPGPYLRSRQRRVCGTQLYR
jgi:hypothetical protein